MFTWNASPGAGSYTLVISAASNYSSPLLNLTILANATNPASYSYIPTKDLTAGKKLYGRVMANGANPSAWSSINFTTPLPPSVPVLLAPANNALLANTVPASYQPTLSWKPVTIPKGASPFVGYELEVSKVADFSSLQYPNSSVDTTKLQVTSFQIPDLLPDNQKYFWRVRAYNQNGDFSSWATFSFRTAIVKPELLLPDNGTTTLHSLRPQFNWSTPAGASSYTLVVSTKANLSSPVLNVTITTLPYNPTVDLPAGKLLYWQVRANGLNGPSLWSTARSFTTPLPPSIPVLVSPAKNALLTSTAKPPVYMPTLSWKAVTVPRGASAFRNYELEVSDKADFSNLLYPNSTVDTTVLTGTSFPIPASLPENTAYYWRVRAYNQNGDFSSWATFSFRTAMITPTLLLPANDPLTSLNNLRPAFSWNSSPGASSYTIVISASSTLASAIVNKVSSTPSYAPTANLPSGKTLYWHVRANGANGPSLWSETWSFRAK
jgi:hypothetical protein